MHAYVNGVTMRSSSSKSNNEHYSTRCFRTVANSLANFVDLRVLPTNRKAAGHSFFSGVRSVDVLDLRTLSVMFVFKFSHEWSAIELVNNTQGSPILLEPQVSQSINVLSGLCRGMLGLFG